MTEFNNTEMSEHEFIFTNDEPSLSVTFKTSFSMVIKRFISLNDLDFITSPSLCFNVEVGSTHFPTRSFHSCISTIQKDHKIIEPNFRYLIKEPVNLTINIIDNDVDRQFCISILYSLEPMNGPFYVYKFHPQSSFKGYNKIQAMYNGEYNGQFNSLDEALLQIPSDYILENDLNKYIGLPHYSISNFKDPKLEKDVYLIFVKTA